MKKLSIAKVLLFLVVMALTTSVADQVISNIKLNSLVSTVQTTEELMLNYIDQVSLKKGDSGPGCLSVGTIVPREYCGLQINEFVKNELDAKASQLSTDLAVQKYSLEKVSLFPFGNEFSEPIYRYGLHLDSWNKYLEYVQECEDYACYWKVLTDPNAISSSFKIAGLAFRESVPIIDFKRNESKIEKLFNQNSDAN